MEELVCWSITISFWTLSQTSTGSPNKFMRRNMLWWQISNPTGESPDHLHLRSSKQQLHIFVPQNKIKQTKTSNTNSFFKSCSLLVSVGAQTQATKEWTEEHADALTHMVLLPGPWAAGCLTQVLSSLTGVWHQTNLVWLLVSQQASCQRNTSTNPKHSQITVKFPSVALIKRVSSLI